MSCTCMVPEEKGGLLNLPTPTVTRTANTLHSECPLGKNASLRDSPTSDYIPEIFFFFFCDKGFLLCDQNQTENRNY